MSAVGRGYRPDCIVRARFSVSPGVKLRDALETFRLDREAKLEQTVQALKRFRQKQDTGPPPRRLEVAVAPLFAKSLLTPSDEDEVNDFDLLTPLGKVSRKSTLDIRKLVPGQVLSTSFLEDTNRVEVNVFMSREVVDTLTDQHHAWRLKAFSFSTGCSISLFPAERRVVPRGRLRGSEDVIKLGYSSLLALQDQVLHYMVGSNPAAELSVLGLRHDVNKTLRDAERLSGAFLIVGEGDKIQIWGDNSQVESVKRLFALASDDGVTGFKIIHESVSDNLSSVRVNVDSEGHRMYSLRVTTTVPANQLKVIIGSEGSALRRLESMTGARVRIFDSGTTGTTQPQEPVKLDITGTVDAVYGAIMELRERADQYAKFRINTQWKEQVLLRNADELRRIAGRQLIGLRGLEKSTGAFIRLSARGDPTMAIRLWGSNRAVEEAIRAIYAILRCGVVSV